MLRMSAEELIERFDITVEKSVVVFCLFRFNKPPKEASECECSMCPFVLLNGQRDAEAAGTITMAKKPEAIRKPAWPGKEVDHRNTYVCISRFQ